jgi:hypothetical protein
MAAQVKRKDPAAVALGRKGGKKGDPARAAKLTPAQRSESARKAVQARWAKSKAEKGGDYTVDTEDNLGMNRFSEFRIDDAMPVPAIGDTSDHAALALLKRIKATNDRTEIRHLTDRLQRVIFHRQYKDTSA